MHTKARHGILLINLGTPDSPAVKDVRRYLREFLMDGRVMDIPWLKRFFLINGIIAPTRAPVSAKAYQQLWTNEGSPLKVHSDKLCDFLQAYYTEEYAVCLAMRYQHPSIPQVLEDMRKLPLQDLLIVPLYPQYASASTGSSIEKVFQVLKGWEVIPHVRVIAHFPSHPAFIQAWVKVARESVTRQPYDHYLFSYHGLPEHQILKASRDNYCQINNKCCRIYHAKNQYCYRAQCFETTRALVEALLINREDTTVCFQSRLGNTPWIQPYTDKVIETLARKGKKRVLVFSPSFVADCLETTVEIGHEYKKLFQDQGGERLDLVESLNTHPAWVECLKQLIDEQIREREPFPELKN